MFIEFSQVWFLLVINIPFNTPVLQGYRFLLVAFCILQFWLLSFWCNIILSPRKLYWLWRYLSELFIWVWGKKEKKKKKKTSNLFYWKLCIKCWKIWAGLGMLFKGLILGYRIFPVVASYLYNSIKSFLQLREFIFHKIVCQVTNLKLHWPSAGTFIIEKELGREGAF